MAKRASDIPGRMDMDIEEEHIEEMLPAQPLSGFGELTAEELARRPTRHLQPGKLEELFEFYVNCSDGGHASKTTFMTTYRTRWRQILKFRSFSGYPDVIGKTDQESASYAVIQCQSTQRTRPDHG